MRNMSFMLTTAAVEDQTKNVTRRLGWDNLKPGDLLQPVLKGMGLKRGESVQKIGCPIMVARVTREPLNAMLAMPAEEQAAVTLLEGFPGMSADEFVGMFCAHNKCAPDTPVNVIEFVYLAKKRRDLVMQFEGSTEYICDLIIPGLYVDCWAFPINVQDDALPRWKVIERTTGWVICHTTYGLRWHRVPLHVQARLAEHGITQEKIRQKIDVIQHIQHNGSYAI